MSVVPAQLMAAAYIASSATSVYTCPSSTRACIKSITLNNTSTSAETVAFNLGPSGASAAASNQILQLSVPAGTSVITQFPFPLVMAATDILYAATTTASKVVISISGTTEAV